MLSFLNTGGADALIDNGVGFWTEHRMLWGEKQWFRVTAKNNEKSLSQVLDRYIMRQKTLLSLTTHKGFAQDLENHAVLTLAAARLNHKLWPEAIVLQPEDDEDQGASDTENVDDEEKFVDDELFHNSTIKAVAESLELEGSGQQRHWVQQDPTNCCAASFKDLSAFSQGRGLCRKVK